MRLALVGRGRAARALAPRWIAAGHTIVDQRARGEPAIEGLAPADVVIVAVSDGAIGEVARRLAVRPGAAEETWLHLSGSVRADALRVSDACPRHVGCLHPLVALAGAGDSVAPLDAVAGIEGEPAAIASACHLARDVGLEPVPIDPDHKLVYHAAAVTVAGHATALFAQAMALMGAAGMRPDEARRALRPLFASAAQNLALGPPADVATGPIVRGDVDTIAGHLGAIADADTRATYRLLARTLLSLVAERMDATVVRTIEKTLDDMT